MEFHLDILEKCFGGEKQSTSKWQIQKKMFTMFEYDMLLLMPYVKCMWISNLKGTWRKWIPADEYKVRDIWKF